MTLEEIKKLYGDNNGYVRCNACPILDSKGGCTYENDCSGYGDAYKRIQDHLGSQDNQNDVVNHPNHYTNGGMECFDEMLLVFGKETVANFCLCNAWKYRYRALYKNGEEDIKKSHWYMNKYKELTSNVV